MPSSDAVVRHARVESMLAIPTSSWLGHVDARMADGLL